MNHVIAFIAAHSLDSVLFVFLAFQTWRAERYKRRMMDWYYVAADHEDEIKRIRVRGRKAKAS